jgi:hypothetical protein
LTIHQNASRRHMKLCRQNKKGETFIDKIKPAYIDLETKGNILKQVQDDRLDANDTVRLKDLFLDDELRKLHNRSKEYDRENPGENVAKLLFPNGNISSVITTSNSKQPQLVAQITKKVKSFGSDHALYPFAKSIDIHVNECNDALAAHEECIKAVNTAKTEVELAKAELRRIYNANYFDAASKFGKSYAERLFPIIYAKNKSNSEPEDPEKD